MAEVRTNLRLPEDVYEQVKQLADKELRSINAQMVVLLQSALAANQRIQRREAEQDEDR